MARTNPYGTTFAPTIPGGRTNPNRPPPVNELAPTPTAGTDPFGLFDDPSTKLFTDLIKNQMGTLSQPINDPTTNAMMALIAGRIPQMLSGGGGSGGNALLGDFINIGRQRMQELQAEPFSAGEEQAMKTKAMEDVEQLRTASKQRVTEDAARRGLGETSGVLQAGYRDVDRSMDANRAKGVNDLMLFIAQERQRRKDAAVGIGQSLAGAGAADAQLRQGDAQLQFSRENAAMGLAKMLTDMSSGLRGETDARRKETLGLAGILADLPVQRLQLMLNVLNGAGGNNPASLASQIADTQRNAISNRQWEQQGQADYMDALGEILGYLGTRGRAV